MRAEHVEEDDETVRSVVGSDALSEQLDVSIHDRSINSRFLPPPEMYTSWLLGIHLSQLTLEIKVATKQSDGPFMRNPLCNTSSDLEATFYDTFQVFYN